MAELSLWDYAVAVYAEEGVSPICLRWQDQLGVDVTVMLSGIWAARHHRALSRSDAEILAEAVRPWREEVVKPLRTVRRRLKEVPPAEPAGDVEHLRGLIAKAELQSERMALSILERRIDGLCTHGADSMDTSTRQNIEAVLSYFDDVANADGEEIDLLVSASGRVMA